ncbi:hypothetical protein GQ43DRAFT_438141, partial [Delitschia confertaspora ATCC 74209]
MPSRWSSPDSSRSSSTSDESEYNGDTHQHVELSGDDYQSLRVELSRRGIGNYKCPHSKTCKKGGWKDGDFVVFKQNSAFKAHLQKHEKPFKCDLPGCNNRSGFARLDQLQRHKQKVQH